MKKSAAAMILALCLLLTSALAGAESYVLGGFDTASSGHDWDNNLFFRRMEERTGISFSFRQYTDAEEYGVYLRQLLNGEETLPDALFKASLSPAETLRLYEAGLLIDLAPYLSEAMPNLSALLDEHPEWKKAITLPDGAIAALPQINELQTNNVVWINTRWLSAVRREMPKTAEELTETLRAFKAEDPNRDGRADEIPLTFTGLWDLRFLGHAFGIISNDYYITVKDGAAVSTLTSPENRAFLSWLREMYAEGLMDSRGFSSSDTLRQITDSNAAITYGVIFGPTPLAMVPASAAADYEALLLEYNGETVYRSLLGDLSRGTFAVTSACKNPAELLSWADYFYTEEGLYLAFVGVEGEEYTRLSDGTWSWNDDSTTVAEVVLKEDNIGEGAMMPAYLPMEYQLSYDDASTHQLVLQLARLKESSVEPCPQVYLTEEQTARLNEIWPALNAYAETQMAWFVAGDVPLNDETWAEFTAEAERLGLNGLTAFFQEALK